MGGVPGRKEGCGGKVGRTIRITAIGAAWLPCAAVSACILPAMRMDTYTKVVLTWITLFLGAIAIRPIVSPAPAFASLSPADLYIEPGVQSLRAPDGSKDVFGKVVVDLRTGAIWGFPTGTKSPYPIVPTQSQPPVSRPFLLGHFEFSALDR